MSDEVGLSSYLFLAYSITRELSLMDEFENFEIASKIFRPFRYYTLPVCLHGSSLQRSWDETKNTPSSTTPKESGAMPLTKGILIQKVRRILGHFTLWWATVWWLHISRGNPRYSSSFSVQPKLLGLYIAWSFSKGANWLLPSKNEIGEKKVGRGAKSSWTTFLNYQIHGFQ